MCGTKHQEPFVAACQLRTRKLTVVIIFGLPIRIFQACLLPNRWSWEMKTLSTSLIVCRKFHFAQFFQLTEPQKMAQITRKGGTQKTKQKKTQIRNFFIFSTSKTWLLRMSETLYLNTSSKQQEMPLRRIKLRADFPRVQSRGQKQASLTLKALF